MTACSARAANSSRFARPVSGSCRRSWASSEAASALRFAAASLRALRAARSPSASSAAIAATNAANTSHAALAGAPSTDA